MNLNKYLNKKTKIINCLHNNFHFFCGLDDWGAYLADYFVYFS